MQATQRPPAPTTRRVVAVGRITPRSLTIRITPEPGPLLRLPTEPRARRRLMAWRQI